MAIVSLFYAAFGYLALLGAILWGMLFVGDGVNFPNMNAADTAAPLEAACVDTGLLLLLALLHLSRGMLCRVAAQSLPGGLERRTLAWAAAAVLTVIYVGWVPLPQVLWSTTGPLQAVLAALFYVAWTLILIGAFLASHLHLFEIAQASDRASDLESSATAVDEAYAQAAWRRQAARYARPARPVLFPATLRQPLYCGILIAVWTPSVMTVGHLLLAAPVTAYLLFDALRAARKSSAARESSRDISLQGQRAAN
jgi:methanethiol S-methyltransferase